MTSSRPTSSSAAREELVALVAAALGFIAMGVVCTLAGLSTAWSVLVVACGVVAVVPSLVLLTSRRRRNRP
jgi:Flp pilus assembly protein TadB